MSILSQYRQSIAAHHHLDEAEVLRILQTQYPMSAATRTGAGDLATHLVEQIRQNKRPSMVEAFLAEYGLSTDEGVSLMCLAEALLRVPDALTLDALIEDKIAPSQWGQHLGQSSSSLVNASTWALMLTGKVLGTDADRGVVKSLHGAIKRLGEPVIRTAARRAMQVLGGQFVLGETIAQAMKRGQPRIAQGYSYSFDMLGEAAITQADADAFFAAYSDAISALTPHCVAADIRDNPGISIKLSALHPRYEEPQRARVMKELVPRVAALALQAKTAGMGLNIDAEEAARLELSLDVIEAVLRDPALAGWDGFGVVVQAYGKRASTVIAWLDALARDLDRKLMVRLVKGAYWDTEIKHAQVEGHPSFPVFTQKAATDVSYLACAQQLLGLTDRIYPQFATHNAHSVAAILEMAEDRTAFEFQRLHGMGEALHECVMSDHATRCRIYAPVGEHRDLLAYLVRRLLENGANSSFVNQIVDTTVPAREVAADPLEKLEGTSGQSLAQPRDLFAPERPNSQGLDLYDPVQVSGLSQERDEFSKTQWAAMPMGAADMVGGPAVAVFNPARPAEKVGEACFATQEDVDAALAASSPWAVPAAQRASILNSIADAYEANRGELCALLAREAGKTANDAISELREAVDFLRYYAVQAIELTQDPLGRFVCISPWNFPLAIFTGQIAAALAAGNAVLAKPAETTSLIAAKAVTLMYEAGVPETALQLLPGLGAEVGHALTTDARIDGVAFTGSTQTAQRINRAMAEHMSPDAPLIAETGGINAMIVDSTALPEQAVQDIVVSAFQSAGQRCSALRVLYLQEDIAETFLQMLYGAMDQLELGDPWAFSTDVGPVIDQTARDKIAAYIAEARANGQVLKQLSTPDTGHFIAPCVIGVDGIGDLKSEVFGPVLHIATFAARDIDQIVDDINSSGYGLTFGMHSRIEGRVAQVVERIQVGNVYVNRNQIGAVVGSQPFGGQGLSGTGPKAGGPDYLPRFSTPSLATDHEEDDQPTEIELQQRIDGAKWTNKALQETVLPGPTGELNQLSVKPRGVILCMGPGHIARARQMSQAESRGCVAIAVSDAQDVQLEALTGFHAVAYCGDDAGKRSIRSALAARDGAILPLLSEADIGPRCVVEQHLCVDTTAAGGNADLLAQG